MSINNSNKFNESLKKCFQIFRGCTPLKPDFKNTKNNQKKKIKKQSKHKKIS